jgi:hypothetical protein
MDQTPHEAEKNVQREEKIFFITGNESNYLKWSAENVADYVCKYFDHVPSIEG